MWRSEEGNEPRIISTVTLPGKAVESRIRALKKDGPQASAESEAGVRLNLLRTDGIKT
jgi:hypothetical protein